MERDSTISGWDLLDLNNLYFLVRIFVRMPFYSISIKFCKCLSNFISVWHWYCWCLLPWVVDFRNPLNVRKEILTKINTCLLDSYHLLAEFILPLTIQFTYMKVNGINKYVNLLSKFTKANWISQANEKHLSIHGIYCLPLLISKTCLKL